MKGTTYSNLTASDACLPQFKDITDSGMKFWLLFKDYLKVLRLAATEKFEATVTSRHMRQNYLVLLL